MILKSFLLVPTCCGVPFFVVVVVDNIVDGVSLTSEFLVLSFCVCLGAPSTAAATVVVILLDFTGKLFPDIIGFMVPVADVAESLDIADVPFCEVFVVVDVVGVVVVFVEAVTSLADGNVVVVTGVDLVVVGVCLVVGDVVVVVALVVVVVGSAGGIAVATPTFTFCSIHGLFFMYVSQCNPT